MDDQAAATEAPRASSSPAASAAAVVALASPVPPPPPPPPPPPQPSSSAAAASASAFPSKEDPPRPVGGESRLRFSVELKPGETTIVSWKRLLKESGKAGGPPSVAAAGDQPFAAAAQAGAVAAPLADELKDASAPPNRFNAVIEKIERLYMGKQSSDEEDLDDIPDDDQYDTEDSFIDDAELDEYFQVDKLSTKHNGYFVNKGKLEQVEPSLSPKEAPKKRRRKDSTKLPGDASHVPFPGDPASVDNVRFKDAPRNVLLGGRKLSPAKVYASYGEHYNEEGKHVRHRTKISNTVSKRRSADFTIRPEEQQTMTVPYKDASSLPLELKESDKHKAGAHSYKGTTHRLRANDSFDSLYQASREKGQVEFQSRKLINGEPVVSAKVQHKERYGSSDYASMNSPGSAYSMHASQQSSSQVKEGSSLRPKGTTLERAIRDLQKIVIECRPPSLDVQEVDPAFQGIKRRLPQEVKQKLAKVARLSASQGKISDDLIDRLMGIVGHLVQRRTLKKNMREMVELGLSAKQQKADRFQQIKREVNEMVRVRVSQLKSQLAEQRDGSADDFQEVNIDERSLKGRYSMDAALEDKICELYDLYVEGMDEDKGPQSRKLYVELAELWPNGFMDNVGIKDAIYRSKERRRLLYRQHKVRDEERIKRKKLASSTGRVRVDEAHQVAQLRAGQERPAPIIDRTAKHLVPSDKPVVSNQAAAGLTGRSVDSTTLSTDTGHHSWKHPDKIRSAANTGTNPEEVKKRMKRKAEPELDPERVFSQHVVEKPKHETNASYQPKRNLEFPGVSGSDQPT